MFDIVMALNFVGLTLAIVYLVVTAFTWKIHASKEVMALKIVITVILLGVSVALGMQGSLLSWGLVILCTFVFIAELIELIGTK
jgi:hypothetical protein